MQHRRINIFVGHFGSGKTEVSVNYAIHHQGILPKTTLVDLDIVNPYFRSADAEQVLQDHGISLVKPLYANTNVDVPALPAEVSSTLARTEVFSVLDVGGDDLGARVLSRYKDEIEENAYDLFFVVNLKRLVTDTADKICHMVETIEGVSRLKVKKIINNTNLLESTNESDIINSQTVVDEVCRRLSIPLAFVSALEEFNELIVSKLQKPYLKIVRYTGPGL